MRRRENHVSHQADKKIKPSSLFWGTVLILSLSFGLTVSLSAQTTVDQRSGRLLSVMTDLVVAAGPVNIEMRRALLPDKGESGLLGSRWRLNVERRLVKEKSQIRIETESGPIVFTQEGSAPDYKNAFGERIHFEKNGQAIYTKKDGTKETYTSDSLLKEIDHRNYNKVIFNYGANKRLSRIERPRKHFIKLKPDPQGRIIGIEASSGDQLTFQKKKHTYSKDGNEHQVTEPLGGKIRKKWTADGSKEETINPLGHKTIIDNPKLGIQGFVGEGFKLVRIVVTKRSCRFKII